MKIDKDDLLKYLKKQREEYKRLAEQKDAVLYGVDASYIARKDVFDNLIDFIDSGELDEIANNININEYYDSVDEQYHSLHKALMNAIKHDEFTNIKPITESILMTAKELKCVRERSVANE